MARRSTESDETVEVPKGFSLVTELEGHTGRVTSVAVTPDGRSVVSGSQDATVRVWDLESGRLLYPLNGHTEGVTSVAVTLDGCSVVSGSDDNTVRVWDLESGRRLHTLKGHTEGVYSVAVTPDGRSVIAGSDDKTVRVWRLESGNLLRTLEGHTAPVFSVAVTADSCSVISGSADKTVRVWDLESGRPQLTLEGHTDRVTSAGVTADGRWIVSTSDDRTVRTWDAPTGRHVRTLEGHNRPVAELALTRNWAATGSRDETVRVWDLAAGRLLATLPAGGAQVPSNNRVAFAPGGTHLLTVRRRKEGGDFIQVWKLDWPTIEGSPDSRKTIRYRNAKVVLVGDTGVGKSGLGAVLAGQPFELTESTHGRKVWLFESKEEPLSGGEHQTRETMLWDLAGQTGYRLVHQLNIDQAVVALVLVDARSETDPLGPAEYWARAIDQARSAVPITKFLVVARIDRGGLAVSPARLQQFAQKFGFSGVFHTSAKTGEGVPAVGEAIRAGIHWDELEEVTSTALFTSIKRFLQTEKARGDQALVEKLETLFERFGSGASSRATLADFRTCISRLQAAGLVEVLLFSVLDKSSSEGGEYVLLQPEYVDAYASAAVMTARDDPRGIGHVLESDLLAGRLRLDGAERISDEKVERLVLTVTIERLLNHDIALRERLADGDYLVFPSEYTRTAPYPRRHAPGVAFDFQGAIRTIFTTLVVRLAHHRDFQNVEFYRDAACYETRNKEDDRAAGRCAVVLDETAPGQGRMSVYFEDDPGKGEQRSFLQFVRQHLEGKAKPGSVDSHLLYFCRVCGHAFDEQAVQNRLKQGSKDIGCPNCDERSLLFDLLMADDVESQADVRRMDTDADSARRRQLAATAIEGKKRIGGYDVFLSYSTKDREKVVALAEDLAALGIRPWLDVWDLVPGTPWQDGLNQAIQDVNAAAVCLGRSGLGPWQDQEVMAFLRQFVKRKSPVIPVLLPGARSEIALPPLLESFLWVDMRKGSPANLRPLANLVAGIFGQRPRAMEPERLADQVAAILAAPRAGSGAPDVVHEIVLPVKRSALEDRELEALRQQTARLLGIPSERLELREPRQGSGSVVLLVKDLNAMSQLFAMVRRSDAALQEFFQRWQIDQELFSRDNGATAQRVTTAIQAEQAETEDPNPLVSLAAVPNAELRKWTGGARVMTVAVVFTDIVDSTKLCVDLGDAAWDGIRQQHFAQAVRLVHQRQGIVIKNTGDGILALFHDATAAVGFALALHGDTGHAVVRIRAGVHVGQVSVDDGDAFGRHMNLTARVMGFAKGSGVVVSARVREDIGHRAEEWSKDLRWTEFPNIMLKGFAEPETLWTVERD